MDPLIDSPEGLGYSKEEEDSSWKQSFPPGISTAFLVVTGAVTGLLGARHKKTEVYKKHCIFDITSSTTGTITIPIGRVTPRPLDLKRLHEESDLLLKTLQVIVDRTLAEGLDIQLYKVPVEAGTPIAALLDPKEHQHYLHCFVEDFVLTKATTARAFYSRTNSLSSITLSQVTVNKESYCLMIEFHLVEGCEKKVAEHIVPGPNVTYPKEKALSLQPPRILQFEGHAFYDGLQLYWWRLPMVHFWMTLASFYSVLTFGMVAVELLAESEDKKQVLYPSLKQLGYGDYILIILSSIAFGKLGSYFARTGVYERIRVGTLHLRGILDNDKSRVSLLVLVCFVPLLQPTGLQLVSDLKALSVEGVYSAATFAVKSAMASLCLVSYPALSWISSIIIASTFIESVYAIMTKARAWSERAEERPRERRRSMLELLRRIGVLFLVLSVYFWYHHLANDENNSSAMVATYWVDISVFFEFGIMACILVLVVVVSLVFVLFAVVFGELRRVQLRIRNRLPHWRL